MENSGIVYTLATRGAYANNDYAEFRMHCVANAEIGSCTPYDSWGGAGGTTWGPYRPVVSISLDSIAIGASGLGTSWSKYSISSN